MLRLMKSNVPLLNVLYKNLHKAKIYVNDMILTTFSPFDVKYKKLNWKSLCLGGWDFHIFPRLHWIMEGERGSDGGGKRWWWQEGVAVGATDTF